MPRRPPGRTTPSCRKDTRRREFRAAGTRGDRWGQPMAAGATRASVVRNGCIGVVVDAGGSQHSVRSALVDADSRLGGRSWLPSGRNCIRGPARTVVGDGAVLAADGARDQIR